MNGGKNTGNFFLENEKRWKWKSDDDKDGKTDEVRGGEEEEEGETEREDPRRRNPLPGSLVSLLPRINSCSLGSFSSAERSVRCKRFEVACRLCRFSREGKNLNRRSLNE